MPRLMSVALTTDAVRSRTKTVTRRLNWWADKNGRRLLNVGDLVTFCPKIQGRRPGEPLERIVTVETVGVRREPVRAITPADVLAEGVPLEHFGGKVPSPIEWARWYCREMGLVSADHEVTRIEVRYPPVIIVAPHERDATRWLGQLVDERGPIGCRPWFVTPERPPIHTLRGRRLWAGGQVVVLDSHGDPVEPMTLNEHPMGRLGSMDDRCAEQLRQLGWDGVIADAAAL